VFDTAAEGDDGACCAPDELVGCQTVSICFLESTAGVFLAISAAVVFLQYDALNNSDANDIDGAKHTWGTAW
jgi:hypothetical protein